MAHLLRYFVLCLLSEFLIVFSLSNNHNTSIGNITGGLVTDDALEKSGILRQLLNQETIIRMALVQNVHSLMKDILTIKNSMLVSETAMGKFKLATEKTIFQLEAEVEKLKWENQRLRNDNAEIQRKLIPCVNGTSQTVQDSISEMRRNFDTKFIQLDSELQTIQARKANVSSIATLETSLSYISTQVGNLSKSVAFTAGTTVTTTSWKSGTLVFDKVINSVGGGYNPHTGIFTAPVKGHYVFFVSIVNDGVRSIYVDIVLNGSCKIQAMAVSFNTNDRYETGTNLVILHLQQGDAVWVKHHRGTGYYTYSDAPVTTFSGFLI
ncbi:heavy metal-binding protein HIP-like isoform X1 [Saccostrea echinata]|uniref:heavy metal-binding protein HIP-like isoform X1 n=1 Tax=Saccostrea echinata TaxID=191078 RepID=UPI002A80B8AB|nr:heavy metal-binding protein HIP-like isoform X1 [Saccostrea echinata]